MASPATARPARVPVPLTFSAEKMSRPLPQTAPNQILKEFFCLESNKDAVEVGAAGELNDAVKAAGKTLREEATLPAHWRALGDLLVGLDRTFTKEQRGNARQLCAQARRFAEAAIAAAQCADAAVKRLLSDAERWRDSNAAVGARFASFELALYELCEVAHCLRMGTLWANHPPLSASQVEWTSHCDPATVVATGAATVVATGAATDAATPAPVYHYVIVKSEGVRTTAQTVRVLASHVHCLAHAADVCGAAHVLATAVPAPQWELQRNDPGLAGAHAALVAAVGAAQVRFDAARSALDAGKHGAWARGDPGGSTGSWRCCTLEKHALVLLEAAEHLVTGAGTPPAATVSSSAESGRGKGAAATTDTALHAPAPPPVADVVRVCLGLRLFAEEVKAAVWRMPLSALGGHGLFASASQLVALTQWAGHPPTHVWRKSPTAPEPSAAAAAASDGSSGGSDGSGGGSCLRVDAAHLGCVRAALNDTANYACTVLEFFAEQPRRRLLDLAPSVHASGGGGGGGNWRAALLLGLCLKDAVMPEEGAAAGSQRRGGGRASAPGSRGGATVGGAWSTIDDVLVSEDVEEDQEADAAGSSSGGGTASDRPLAIRGAISFPYRHQLPDATAMLKVAYEGALKEVAAAADAAAAASPTGEGVNTATAEVRRKQLLHDAAVARKELAYCQGLLRRHAPPGSAAQPPPVDPPPVPGAPSSCSKEAAMRRLGDALLGPAGPDGRPFTATEVREALRDAERQRAATVGVAGVGAGVPS
jgi:hypothetical protein